MAKKGKRNPNQDEEAPKVPEAFTCNTCRFRTTDSTEAGRHELGHKGHQCSLQPIRKRYDQLTEAEKLARNQEARDALLALTPKQLDEVGLMFGMSNLGLERYQRPESVAETEEMYDMMMEEISWWQKRLRSAKRNWKKEIWGCHDDLFQMIEKAKQRRPSDSSRPCCSAWSDDD